MVILHTLDIGGRKAETRKHTKIEGESSRRATGTKVSGRDVNSQVNRKMEFMYCIPDLEVFIDKTIKKCLLEYDLDANDTEAVLDDMEKAWPKSPLRPGEKYVLKDYNDNTEKATNSRPASVANHLQEAPPLDTAVQKEGTTDLPTERVENTPEVGLSKKEELVDVVSNGNKDHQHVTIEGYRSDTSSPDVGDRKLQTPRHPKLKSLLQQRYFEGQESTKKDPASRKEDGKHDQPWETNKHMSSNLDLLASAANIHTESANATEEHKMQAIRRLQEESEREYLVKAAKQQHDRSVLESTSPEGHRSMPVLLKLMSASSSSLPESSTSPPKAVVSDLHGSSLKVRSPDTCQRISPSTTFHEDPRFLPTSKQHERYAAPVLSRERTEQLLQHYQNGYHAVIPQDGLVNKREYSSSSDEGDLKLGRGQFSSSLPSSLSWDGAASSRGTSNSHYNHFASSSHYQNHLDRSQPNPPDSFLQQFHYHGSRIANIIAEELQKDDDNEQESHMKQSYSDDRVVSAEVKSSPLDQPRLAKTSLLPGLYKRVASNETMTVPSHNSPAHTQIDMHYKATASMDKPQVYSRPQTMPQLLPAHLAMTNTHSGGANLASHLDHTISLKNNGVVNMNRVTSDDNQPQDLSTKSRKSKADAPQHAGHHFRDSNPALTSMKYMTATGSPSAAAQPAPHLESPATSKSPSPCHHSDNRSHHSTTNKESIQLKTLEKWDNRDPMSHLYVSSARLINSQNLIAKGPRDLHKDASETGDFEAHKRRRLE